MMNKYLITCNNYDGSYDFIISCNESIANELKTNKINIVKDQKIIYDTTLKSNES